MKTKGDSTIQIAGIKQELIDIYRLTFFKKPSVQPISNDEKSKRKLSIKRKAGSVKEIMQVNTKPQKECHLLQPKKLPQFPRVLSQDTRCQDIEQAILTERVSLPKSGKRYKSVNLTKKFQYLHSKQEGNEVGTFESYKSNRLTYDLKNPTNFQEDSWKNQFSQFEKASLIDNYCPKIELQNQKKVLPKRIVFPKEFSSNGLYKKYFA